MPDESARGGSPGGQVSLARRIELKPKDKAADLLFRLVKDRDAYRSFERDPAGTLRSEGIGRRDVDPAVFAQLAHDLITRADGKPGPIGHQMTEAMETKSETGQQFNFDHSHHATRNYNTDSTVERGMRSETTSTTWAGATNDFGGTAILGDDRLLRHEIRLLFYPGQPLVTPTLVDRIKTSLKRWSGR